jgi:hypothetical protein
MGSSDCPERGDSQRGLLEEGARSSLDAVTALIAFRSEVQGICRTVLERHLENYAAALKVQLKRSEIKDAESPSFAKWEGDYWTLGVKIVRPKFTSAIRWWESWCCFTFYRDDPGLSCWILEWFPTKPKAAEVLRRFQSINKSVECEDNNVWIEQNAKVDEVCNLESHLDRLVLQWIELWNEVGGIKKVFKD